MFNHTHLSTCLYLFCTHSFTRLYLFCVDSYPSFTCCVWVFLPTFTCFIPIFIPVFCSIVPSFLPGGLPAKVGTVFSHCGGAGKLDVFCQKSQREPKNWGFLGLWGFRSYPPPEQTYIQKSPGGPKKWGQPHTKSKIFGKFHHLFLKFLYVHLVLSGVLRVPARP